MSEDLKEIYIALEARIAECCAEVREAMAQAVFEASTRSGDRPEPAEITIEIGDWLWSNDPPLGQIQKLPMDQILKLASLIVSGPNQQASLTESSSALDSLRNLDN
jgi:hypothetical protein